MFRSTSRKNSNSTGSEPSDSSRSSSSSSGLVRFLKGNKAVHPPKEGHQLVRTVSEAKTSHSETTNDVPVKKDVIEHDNTYQHFPSRQEAYKKLEALINEKDGNPVIGIYGMRGVGKTLMMEEACKQAEDNKIFNKVMIAHVGKEVDVINIQDQLASYLNCYFEPKDDELHRASQLRKSMKEVGTTLVMLDNVWGAIPLEKFGIPFTDGHPSKGYKIILTSLTHDVCLRNNCKDPIEIKELMPEEARELFRNTVGDSSKEDSLVDEVCKRCAGLPLLIRAVGRALKGVSDAESWKEALNQIEDGRFGWIDGIEPQVYACLKLSFDKLPEDSKRCLFLCALFPENAVIDIEMLSYFASGSPVFKSKEDTHLDINRLKSSYFLVQYKDEKTIQVPNTIRDVARSVATRDLNYAFSYIRCKSWLPENVDYSTRKLLHLDLQGDDVGFPNDLVCQDLRSLWLHCNHHKQRLSGGLFTNLNCLLIKGMVFAENQWSTDILKALRTLILDGCKLHITFLCFIANHLETLRIRDCDFPDSKDDDIQQLVDNRQLNVFSNLITVEINRCRGSKFLFPAAVAKKLSKLQELRIEGCHVMEEIVKVDGLTEIIRFPELVKVELNSLRSLKCFSRNPSNAFNMPALKSLSVDECPSMDTFTAIETEAPLVNLLNGHHVTKDNADLNRFVREQVYQKKHSGLKTDKSLGDEHTGAGGSSSKGKEDDNLKDGAGGGESSVL